MKPTSFAVKTALLATLIVSGKTFAQTLPDEINHPQYLKIYQNLEQVLATKTAEFNTLADQKAKVESDIAQMERDQRDLPARNAELARLIDMKRQDLARINSEIAGLEGVLNKIIEDLRRLDAMIAQLQNDIGEESNRSRAIEARRSQVIQDVNRINARLQQELGQEQESIKILDKLNRDMGRDIQNRNEDIQERQTLTINVERFKKDVITSKNKVASNNQTLGTKKAQLTEAQNKLPVVKNQLAKAESDVKQIDAELAPKKAKLSELNAELGRLMPEVAKLQKENADLNAKIEANKGKIAASGLENLKNRRDALEKELAGVNSQIASLGTQILAAQEALKPDLAEQNEVMVKIRELSRSGANPAELARLKLQLDAIEKRIAPKKAEIMRMQKQRENLVLSVAPKNQELARLKEEVTKVEATVATLNAEIASAKEKIAANQKIIDEQMLANSGLMKEIKDLEAAIKLLEANRDRASKEVAQLKSQESQLTSQVSNLTKDIQSLEAEIVQLNKSIAEMEKAIADYPLSMKRLELHIKKMDEQIQAAKLQIIREEKLLARIQQDRVAVERDLNAAQSELDRVNGDLAQSQRLIGALQNKRQEEIQNREALTRYNQDSIRKYDGLKAERANAEKMLADSQQEISVNQQDINTIAQELPRLRNELGALAPRVSSAERAMNEAQKKATDASSQYQSRLSLYERYLGEAQSLGSERAKLGTTDGVKAGAVEARTKATRLATENAAAEAKWVAMRRGYVRGEIAGFESGFDLGMSSSADAARGDSEGRVAGAKRAKDRANLVLKPEFYTEELNRRLQDDEVSSFKNMSMKINDELKMGSMPKMVVRSDIPDLTQAEIDASARILSSLDALIEKALVEATEAVNLRSRLANASSVYTAPGAGENANNANCSGVYKNVKDFIDACKASYGASYQGLYAAAHEDSFIKEYGKSFSDQVIKTFEAELARLYPGFLKEATNVGKEVGLTAGKKEIYTQSFARAENAAYSANISQESARAEQEAVELVEKYINEGSALTLKGEPKLKGDAAYGIAPGVEAELRMVLKNIGAKVAENSTIRITSASSNVEIPSRSAGIAAVAPKTQANLAVLKLKVSDQAIPGSLIVIAGEVVHAGNHYSAVRKEEFRLEATIAVNPAVETSLELDATPKVSTLGIVKKHEIDLTLRPKFEGVDQGYEISIEEVGSQYARFSSNKATTERLARGNTKKITFQYKLDKSARGKTINFKILVKNGAQVVKIIDQQIKAE